MFTATYTGQIGLYKHQSYKIRIGDLNGRVVVNRSCGAGRVYYQNIVEFLNNWDKIRRV